MRTRANAAAATLTPTYSTRLPSQQPACKIADLFNLVGINGHAVVGPRSPRFTPNSTDTSTAASSGADAATTRGGWDGSGLRARGVGGDGSARGRGEVAVTCEFEREKNEWEREKGRAELQKGIGFECIFPTPRTSRGGSEFHKFFAIPRGANRALADHIASNEAIDGAAVPLVPSPISDAEASSTAPPPGSKSRRPRTRAPG